MKVSSSLRQSWDKAFQAWSQTLTCNQPLNFYNNGPWLVVIRSNAHLRSYQTCTTLSSLTPRRISWKVLQPPSKYLSALWLGILQMREWQWTDGLMWTIHSVSITVNWCRGVCSTATFTHCRQKEGEMRGWCVLDGSGRVGEENSRNLFVVVHYCSMCICPLSA